MRFAEYVSKRSGMGRNLVANLALVLPIFSLMRSNHCAGVSCEAPASQEGKSLARLRRKLNHEALPDLKFILLSNSATSPTASPFVRSCRAISKATIPPRESPPKAQGPLG